MIDTSHFLFILQNMEIRVICFQFCEGKWTGNHPEEDKKLFQSPVTNWLHTKNYALNMVSFTFLFSFLPLEMWLLWTFFPKLVLDSLHPLFLVTKWQKQPKLQICLIMPLPVD